MSICPGCNKFPALSTDQEPEVNDLEALIKPVDEKDLSKGYEAHITGNVRIVLTSECCSEEIKETTFDIDIPEVDVAKADGCTCEDWPQGAEVTEDGPQVTDRSGTFNEKTYKTGPKKGQTVKVPIPGRYQKRFYGVETGLIISCGCGKQIGETKFEDECPASGMDELN